MIAIKAILMYIVIVESAYNTGLEIMVPPGQLITHVDHIYIVGKTAAPIVEIALNNEKIDEIIVKDSVFHSLVKFGFGLNEILITPIYSSLTEKNISSEKILVLYSPRNSDKYEKLFDEYSFHNDSSRDACLFCHKSENLDSRTIDSDQFCFGCHAEINLNFRSHIPRSEKTCAICHNISPNLRFIATESPTEKNPCFSCHKDKIGEFAQEYVHGPVAGGSCVICHDPHGSEFDNSLIYPTEVLCQTCHSNLDEARSMKVQHKPFELGKCSRCHDPHSTSNKWVLVKNSQEICVPCHLPKGKFDSHSHPYNVKPKRELLSPLELTEAGQLECLSCHDPHASDAEHLLRTSRDQTCLGCHPDR